MHKLYKHGTLCHKAYELAIFFHEGQVDKAGNDYMEHLIEVSSIFMAQDKQVVSLLHDIIEDTSCCAYDLIENGIPEELVASVVVLTRLPDETYFDFIHRILADPRAVEVKIADIRHNMDETRFADPASYPSSLRERYQKALRILEASI